MANYGSYAAVLNGVNFPNIKMADPDFGIDMHTIMAAGQIDPVDFSLAFQDMKIPIETHDIYKLLAATGGSTLGIALSPLIGLKCASGATFQWQKASDGTFASGSNHFTLVSPLGYLNLEEISAEQDAREPAMAKLSYCLLCSDITDVTKYCTLSAAAALTGSPGLTTHFAMGPLYINGAQLTGIQRGRFTTGSRYQTIRTDGNVVATEGIVVDRNLQLELDLNDLSAITALQTAGLFSKGINAAAGTVAWYLQKCVTGGERVSAATAEHIKLSFTSSTIEARGIAKGMKTDAQAKLIIHLKNQGVAASVASAIP